MIKENDIIKYDLPSDLFITCCSFEQRCLGVIQRMRDHGSSSVILIDFSSQTSKVGERMRKEHRDMMFDIARTIDKNHTPRILVVPPYSPYYLLQGILSELRIRDIDLSKAIVSVDMSCFTKIQLLYILRLLVEKIKQGRLRLFYTLPKKYNTEISQKNTLSSGFKGPLTIPFNKEILVLQRNIVISHAVHTISID